MARNKPADLTSHENSSPKKSQIRGLKLNGEGLISSELSVEKIGENQKISDFGSLNEDIIRISLMRFILGRTVQYARMPSGTRP